MPPEVLSGTEPSAKSGELPTLETVNVSLLGKSPGAVGTNKPKVSLSLSIDSETEVVSVNVTAPLA